MTNTYIPANICWCNKGHVSILVRASDLKLSWEGPEAYPPENLEKKSTQNYAFSRHLNCIFLNT